MIISAFFFCLMTVFVKMASTEMNTMQIVFVRGVFTLILTFIILKRKSINMWGQRKKILIMRGITGSVALFFVYESINRLPLSEATIIQYLYPIFISIFAHFILHEKLSKKVFYSVIIGFIGIYVVLDFPLLVNNLKIEPNSLMIAMVGSVLTALAYVLVRHASNNESTYVIMFYFPLFTVPISAPFALIDWSHPDQKGWLILLMIGVCTQLGQTFLTFGYKTLQASKAGLTSYFQVPFSAIFGYLIFYENISFNFVLGTILVFISILIIMRENK